MVGGLASTVKGANGQDPTQVGGARGIISAGVIALLNGIILFGLPVSDEQKATMIATFNPFGVMIAFVLFAVFDRWLGKGNGP